MGIRDFGLVLIILATATTAGCTGKSARNQGPPATEEDLAKARATYLARDCVTQTPESWAKTESQEDRRLRYRAITEVPLAEASAFYSNVTQVSYDGLLPGKGHGTQIEYTSADGRAHLWYPGNSRILHGRWKIDKEGAETVACFDYLNPNGYNPVTGHQGAGFECGSFHNQRYATVDILPGDVFNLASSNTVVKPLPRDAVKPYIPRCAPFRIPHLTDGKSPLQHLQEDLDGSLR